MPVATNYKQVKKHKKMKNISPNPHLAHPEEKSGRAKFCIRTI